MESHTYTILYEKLGRKKETGIKMTKNKNK